MAFSVEQVVVGPFETNCYLVTSGGGTLVIDPGDDAPQIASCVRGLGLRVVRYLLTHGHMDHVSALAELCEAFPAPVSLHPLDAAFAFTPANAMPPFYPPPRAPSAVIEEILDGDVLRCEGIECRVIGTPGHTPGSVGFLFPEAGALFSGDTLFCGSVGRTDMAGGDGDALMRSLTRLMELPDTVAVYPGHGACTTIAEERGANPFVTGRI